MWVDTMYCTHLHLHFCKYFCLMMAYLSRNYSPTFKITKYKIAVFDEVYILLHFNTEVNCCVHTSVFNLPSNATVTESGFKYFMFCL
jgi:hypothetical protein